MAFWQWFLIINNVCFWITLWVMALRKPGKLDGPEAGQQDSDGRHEWPN